MAILLNMFKMQNAIPLALSVRQRSVNRGLTYIQPGMDPA